MKFHDVAYYELLLNFKSNYLFVKMGYEHVIIWQ